VESGTVRGASGLQKTPNLKIFGETTERGSDGRSAKYPAHSGGDEVPGGGGGRFRDALFSGRGGGGAEEHLRERWKTRKGTRQGMENPTGNPVRQTCDFRGEGVLKN